MATNGYSHTSRTGVSPSDDVEYHTKNIFDGSGESYPSARGCSQCIFFFFFKPQQQVSSDGEITTFQASVVQMTNDLQEIRYSDTQVNYIEKS